MTFYKKLWIGYLKIMKNKHTKYKKIMVYKKQRNSFKIIKLECFLRNYFYMMYLNF